MDSLFIVGAGFTAEALGEKAPLNDQLLERISAQMQSDELFIKYRRKYETDRIEEFLTFLDLEAQKGADAKSNPVADLRTRINAAIVNVCKDLRFQEGFIAGKPWVETFCKSALHKNDVIVDLNYDCFLEGALDHYDAWSPNGGYPKALESFFADSFPLNDRKKGVLLYKIHGSENFGISSFFDKPDKQHVGVALSPDILPRAAAHSHFGAGTPSLGSYIIAPSYIKIPVVQIGYLMLETLGHAANAKNLVIVGCAMRPEDSFLYLLLTNFLGRNVSGKKIVILDRAAEVVKGRLDAYLSWIHGFEMATIATSISEGMERLAESLNSK